MLKRLFLESSGDSALGEVYWKRKEELSFPDGCHDSSGLSLPWYSPGMVWYDVVWRGVAGVLSVVARCTVVRWAEDGAILSPSGLPPLHRVPLSTNLRPPRGLLSVLRLTRSSSALPAVSAVSPFLPSAYSSVTRDEPVRYKKTNSKS